MIRNAMKKVAREWETGTPQYYLQNLAWSLLLLYAIAVIGLCPLFATGEPLFPRSHANTYPTADSQFMLKVAADGHTTFVGARNISRDLREEIMDKVYPSPEAAEEAASSSIEERAGPPHGLLRWLGPQPAYAHAVNVCTTRPRWNAKVSHQTGSGRHLTWRRFDKNGYRYTRTDHQVLSGPNYVWVSTETYFYKINKRYC